MVQADANPYASLTPYELRQVSRHIGDAALWDELEGLLTDWQFLEAKTEAGPAFDLAEDVNAAVATLPEGRPARRALELLREALQRDLHFIARHAQDYPQGLFQCLWNSAWWYDCTDAPRYHRSAGPVMLRALRELFRRFLPKSRERRPLSSWVESWRQAREGGTPGFRWLRSLRPPAERLDSLVKAVFSGHEGGVTSVAYSPDGRRLASGSFDSTVRLWDVASGRVLCILGHEESVWGVTWSPDGQRLATASHDSTVRLWEASAGRELRRLPCQQVVNCVAFCPDGRLAAGSFSADSAWVWDVTTGHELYRLPRCNGVLTWSPDGRLLATASLDTVRVYDAQTGRELYSLTPHQLPHARRQTVSDVAFSPGGRLAIALGRQIRIWDLGTGREISCLADPTSWVNRVAYSCDGQRLASAGGQTVCIWAAENGGELQRLTGHTAAVGTLSWSPHGGQLASGSEDGTVRLWDATGGRKHERVVPLEGHEDAVLTLAFSPDGRLLASGGGDETVRLWDAASGRAQGRLTVGLRDAVRGWAQSRLTGHAAPVSHLAFAARGRLASGCHYSVWLWDAARRRALGHTWPGEVQCMALAADGRRLASGGYGVVRLWDPASGQEVCWRTGRQEIIRSMAFSPDGRRLACGGSDGMLQVWDAVSGRELTLLTGPGENVSGIAFAPDSRRLAYTVLDAPEGHEAAVRVWDVDSGRELYHLTGRQSPLGASVAWSPDGKRLACGAGGVVTVWETTAGQCLEIIKGTGDVAAIAAGPPRYPYRAVRRGMETVVESAATGETLAWLPLALETIVTHPSGRVWAGAVSNSVCLFTLEGAGADG